MDDAQPLLRLSFLFDRSLVLCPLVWACAGTRRLESFPEQHAAASCHWASYGRKVRQPSPAPGASGDSSNFRCFAVRSFPGSCSSGCVRHRIHADHAFQFGRYAQWFHPADTASGCRAVSGATGICDAFCSGSSRQFYAYHRRTLRNRFWICCSQAMRLFRYLVLPQVLTGRRNCVIVKPIKPRVDFYSVSYFSPHNGRAKTIVWLFCAFF